MSRAVAQVGPADNGKRMSLEEFEHAEAKEGHSYELSRGVIIVVDVPDWGHLAQLDEAREQFSAYRRRHKGRIYRIAHGADCKILLPDLESERHPDLAVYMAPPTDMTDIWAHWVPALVIEIVSKSSAHRDYVEKREEYLRFGVREYWIIDSSRQEMLALRRSGRKWVERTLGPQEIFRTRLLPDFEFDLKAVFDAARAAE